MESASEIARYAVEALREGHLEHYGRYLLELEQMLGSGAAEVHQHLVDAGLPLAYLQKAAMAADSGDKEATDRFLLRAADYIEPDEITALAEMHRLSFVVQAPLDLVSPQTRLGFAAV